MKERLVGIERVAGERHRDPEPPSAKPCALRCVVGAGRDRGRMAAASPTGTMTPPGTVSTIAGAVGEHRWPRPALPAAWPREHDAEALPAGGVDQKIRICEPRLKVAPVADEMDPCCRPDSADHVSLHLSCSGRRRRSEGRARTGGDARERAMSVAWSFSGLSRPAASRYRRGQSTRMAASRQRSTRHWGSTRTRSWGHPAPRSPAGPLPNEHAHDRRRRSLGASREHSAHRRRRRPMASRRTERCAARPGAANEATTCGYQLKHISGGAGP